jgi:hypothetical protein
MYVPAIYSWSVRRYPFEERGLLDHGEEDNIKFPSDFIRLSSAIDKIFGPAIEKFESIITALWEMVFTDAFKLTTVEALLCDSSLEVNYA